MHTHANWAKAKLGHLAKNKTYHPFKNIANLSQLMPRDAVGMASLCVRSLWL